ncbi:MAG: hypothetical protein LBG20_03605 [Holosporaceae bacterium]|nr:hypothetical protein [Holosporaceae bacterium]
MKCVKLLWLRKKFVIFGPLVYVTISFAEICADSRATEMGFGKLDVEEKSEEREGDPDAARSRPMESRSSTLPLGPFVRFGLNLENTAAKRPHDSQMNDSGMTFRSTHIGGECSVGYMIKLSPRISISASVGVVAGNTGKQFRASSQLHPLSATAFQEYAYLMESLDNVVAKINGVLLMTRRGGGEPIAEVPLRKFISVIRYIGGATEELKAEFINGPTDRGLYDVIAGAGNPDATLADFGLSGGLHQVNHLKQIVTTLAHEDISLLFRSFDLAESGPGTWDLLGGGGGGLPCMLDDVLIVFCWILQGMMDLPKQYELLDLHLGIGLAGNFAEFTQLIRTLTVNQMNEITKKMHERAQRTAAQDALNGKPYWGICPTVDFRIHFQLPERKTDLFLSFGALLKTGVAMYEKFSNKKFQKTCPFVSFGVCKLLRHNVVGEISGKRFLKTSCDLGKISVLGGPPISQRVQLGSWQVGVSCTIFL